MSHPMWVRGLKLQRTWLNISKIMSHPMWVRGLKLPVSDVCAPVGRVAPYVGAWIETAKDKCMKAGLTSRTLCGCVD